MRDVLLVLAGFGVFSLVWAIFLFAKSRTAGGADAELAKLKEDLNKLIQDQTGRFVEKIDRVREENRSAIGTSFAETRKNLDESLSLGRKEISDSMGTTQQILSQKLETILKEAAEIKAASGAMLEMGKNIKQLSEILDNPKSRGGFGEFQLEMLLSQAIPADRFKTEYAIGSGRVDAAILFKDSVLCIDSKFPMSNLKKFYESENGSEQKEKHVRDFYRDVKKHAKSIAEKYIAPEITMDFAIMFIPSESVFMEIVSNTDLNRSLHDMRVVPASPNFLYVYFQALAIGFRGMAVEKRAGEIVRAISELKIGFERFHDNFRVMGGHIENASKKYAEAEKQIGRLELSLENIQMGSPSEIPAPGQAEGG